MDSDAKQAIHRLYEAYADDIYRYARLMLHDENDAHDVVQEVFYRAFKGWPTFRHDASESTWLTTIARHYIYDLIRKRQNARQFLSAYTPPYLVDEQPDVENLIVIEKAVANLKENYRQVFVLRHVQGLSVAETAKILGWSHGKVRITDLRASTG
jgi:RNA polymerase sigma-70 factor, ECF subfamily